MTGTTLSEDGGTELEGGLSILLVDDDEGVRQAIAKYARQNYSDLRVVGEPEKGDGLSRLASEPIDCLVIEPDTLDDAALEFVSDVHDIRPECPIVWLTRLDPTDMNDDVLEAGTTIVEKGEDSTDWGFLFDKIESAVQGAAIDSPDAELFRTLVETASDGLYTLDATGRVIYLNQAFAEMLGYTQKELFGLHASHVMAPGELERGQKVIQQVLEDPTRDTHIMDMEMETQGGERIVVSVHFRVLTRPDGSYDGVMGVVRDITDRKQRQRELQRQRARLEEFASVVSHDLRNPLNVAKGRIDLARVDNDNEHLSAAADALDRMDRLITDLLELARQGELVEEVEPVDLDRIARKAWDQVATDGTLSVDVDDYMVQADPDRLVQVFQNLFQNAVDHAGPHVTIYVGLLDDNRGFYIADDGAGIPADHRDRVFERGYTTGQDGTGFGLAIVENIVEAHGWTVEVTEGRLGGARFEIIEEMTEAS